MTFTNNFDPILLELGPLSIHWYGLLFATGIVLNYFILRWAFKREGHSLEDLDSLVIYLFLGLVIGARLGHIFFYNAHYFLSNPLEILKIWNGGLASHGAAIGLFIAYLIWLKVHKKKFSSVVNALVLPMPLTAAFVRVGNFFNSEIVGYPTGGDYGVIFQRLGEDFPRHPAQLYEAGASLIIFIILFFVFKKYGNKLPGMFLLFLYLLLYFGARFVIEYFKDLHTLPEDFPLSMGQVLSLTPILIALVYFIFFLPKQLRKK